MTAAWKIPSLRRSLARQLAQDRTQAVIDLMPHVWSPFLVSTIQNAGARYLAVMHDADSHPGDRTGLARRILDRAACRADRVIALSDTVARRLLSDRRVSPERLAVLFHPDLRFAPAGVERKAPESGMPLRLLFLGRIMAYKGLPLFLDAVDRLRAEGVAVTVGVFGEGQLGADARRLAAMEAEVVNRWLSEEEIGAVLPQYDALVASHLEASQSGVVAAALGARLPCVVTPVGGLTEQVEDGATGVVAGAVTADALAAAVLRLFFTPGLYQTICRGIAERRGSRAMSRFVAECIRVAGETMPVRQ